MKRLVILISLVFVAVTLMAQTPNSVTEFNADSTLNAETVYLAIASPNAITRNYAVTMNLVPENNTGTATVTCVPQGSTDNSVWFDIESSADTVNNAGTIAVVKYEYPNAYWRYYRFKLTSTGSGVTDFTGELGIKKK